MALKRTRCPFYGKANAGYDRADRAPMRRGDHDSAKELFDAARARENIRAVKNAAMMCNRPIGRFMKVPRRVARFLRSYTGR